MKSQYVQHLIADVISKSLAKSTAWCQITIFFFSWSKINTQESKCVCFWRAVKEIEIPLCFLSTILVDKSDSHHCVGNGACKYCRAWLQWNFFFKGQMPKNRILELVPTKVYFGAKCRCGKDHNQRFLFKTPNYLHLYLVWRWKTVFGWMPKDGVLKCGENVCVRTTFCTTAVG